MRKELGSLGRTLKRLSWRRKNRRLGVLMRRVAELSVTIGAVFLEATLLVERAGLAATFGLRVGLVEDFLAVAMVLLF